jgi:hypothetical protein
LKKQKQPARRLNETAQRPINRDDKCGGMTESEEPRAEFLSVPAPR